MANFCPNCGSRLDEDSVFCGNCGFKLSKKPEDPSQANQTYQQPQGGYPAPGQQYPSQQQYPQQPYQPSFPPGPQNRQQQPKKNTGLIIGLIIAGVAIIAAVIVVIFVIIPAIKSNGGNTAPTYAATQATVPQTEKATDAPTAAPTEAPTQAPTSAPTQAPTQAPTEAPKPLPYSDSLGKINATDFAWISDAMSGSLTGSFISNDDLVGKWKAEFIFDGIWELVYITIDRDGKITVQPYQINYGDGWEDESGDASYSFNGSFDINRVYGSGEYGKIDLYQFLESGGTEYGLGEFNTKTGNTAKVYMVRP